MILRVLRSFLGTLVIVPLVVMVAGSHWTWAPMINPIKAKYVPPVDRVDEKPRDVQLWNYSDGTWWERGVVLPNGAFVEVELSRAVTDFSVQLQADFNDRYLVSGSPDGITYQEIWVAPTGGEEKGLRTRASDSISGNVPIRWLRITPKDGDGYCALSWISLHASPTNFPHWLLIPLFWGVFILLSLLRRLGGIFAAPFEFWEKWDTLLAASFLYCILFEVGPVVLGLLAVGAGCAVIISFLKAFPKITVFVLVPTCAAVVLVAPRVLEKLVVSQLARFHQLDVDHRMKPFSSPGINSDGIRFAGEATDLKEEDFVIGFLGDSFTYGWKLESHQSFPYQVEKILQAKNCRVPIRAVNFGWTSSSPLLNLRLMKEIGYKYNPDLLLYTIDMTDFDDDLRYEEGLKRGGDFEPDTSQVLMKLAQMHLPWLSLSFDQKKGLEGFAKLRGKEEKKDEGDEVWMMNRKCGQRFFVTNCPLDDTRESIERGVMRNLDALNTFAREVLSAKFGLMLAPRAYQYSTAESPKNYEFAEYTVMGPYVKEPFRYFDEKAPSLPYPVFSALQTFERSKEFPLYFEDDPHWNERGTQIMAEAAVQFLLKEKMVPCE